MKTIVPKERYYFGRYTISDILLSTSKTAAFTAALDFCINAIVREFLKTQQDKWLGQFFRFDFEAVSKAGSIGCTELTLRLGVHPIEEAPKEAVEEITYWWQSSSANHHLTFDGCPPSSIYHPVERLAVALKPSISGFDFFRTGPTLSDRYFTVTNPIILNSAAGSYNKNDWMPGSATRTSFNHTALAKLFADPFASSFFMGKDHPNNHLSMIVAFSEATFCAQMDLRHVLVGIFANVCTRSMAAGRDLLVPASVKRSRFWDDLFIVSDATGMTNSVARLAKLAKVYSVKDVLKDLGNDAT